MSNFITYLALEKHSPVDASEALASCRKLAEGAPFEIAGGGPVAGRGPHDFSAIVNGVAVAVMFVDEPLPQDAWAEAVRLAFAWPEAGEAMQRQRAHVIVAAVQPARNHPEALGAASAVTLVAGAVAALTPLVATVFTESNAIVEGEKIVGMAREFAAGQVPALLWTTLIFLQGRDLPDGTPTAAALTAGLRPFIGREIEFHPTPLHPTQIAERLIGLVRYLVVNGPVIGHGETVGLTERERIRVRFADQGQRPGIPVMILNLEIVDPNAPVPPELSGGKGGA